MSPLLFWVTKLVYIKVFKISSGLNIEAVPWLVVSVNGVFIDRAMFKHHTLHDGDAVEMIYVRGGG